jgi:hypothetical protein
MQARIHLGVFPAARESTIGAALREFKSGWFYYDPPAGRCPLSLWLQVTINGMQPSDALATGNGIPTRLGYTPRTGPLLPGRRPGQGGGS